jgi:hypothetical protein
MPSQNSVRTHVLERWGIGGKALSTDGFTSEPNPHPIIRPNGCCLVITEYRFRPAPLAA